jgi:hypothetical protein
MSRDAAVKLRKLLEVFSVLVAAGSCLYDAIDTQMRRHQVSDDGALCEITAAVYGGPNRCRYSVE